MDKNTGTQVDKYNTIYDHSDYVDLDLPDYKITNYKKVSNKKILIVGVGTGRDIKYLISDNDVWGIDSSITAVKNSCKIGINAIKIDVENGLNKFKETQFDIIVIKDVLEHLNNPREVLISFEKKLTRGGYIVISVPNHFYLPFRLRMLFGKNLIWKTIGHDHTKLFDEWNYMHKIYFTWNGFRRFIRSCNLKIIRYYWDFGTLAHYSQPELFFSYVEQTSSTSKHKKIYINILRLSWKIFNIIFPKFIRSKLVSLDPALFSAGFYVWCKPDASCRKLVKANV